MKEIEFSTLKGEKASLYYHNILNQFQLGSVIFEVIEDEDDGYRSYLKNVSVVEDNAPKGQLLAEVTIDKSVKIDDGWTLRDEEGFCWVTFGTDNTDNYYPQFIFQREAKPPIEDKIKQLIK